MARPTRLGRPRWPSPLFFRLSALVLRPIDRHSTHARPAPSDALCNSRLAGRFSNGPVAVEYLWQFLTHRVLGQFLYDALNQ